MALRAGYYGIKKNVLAAISNLSGAKIIKSIGDGLKLTSAGKLSCDIDTDTMMFKSGKLTTKDSVKTYSYVGTNSSTLVLTLPDEFSEIIGIVENGVHAEHYVGYLAGFLKGAFSTVNTWRDINTPQYNLMSSVNIEYDQNDSKKFTLIAKDSGQAQNYLDVNYTVYYR